MPRQRRVESGVNLGKTELTAVVALLSSALSEQQLTAIRMQLTTLCSPADIYLEALIIDEEEQNVEEAVFYLTSEYKGEPELFIIAGEQCATFDLVEITQRCLYHFPRARNAVLTLDGATLDHGFFHEFGASHYVLAMDDLPTLMARLIPDAHAMPAADDPFLVNRPLIENQARLTEISMGYTKKSVEGRTFSSIDLNTPVAPKALSEEETVDYILSQPRTLGRVLLVVPSQFNVYGIKINPAYPALGTLWIAAMLEKAGHTVEVIDMDADEMDVDDVLNHIAQIGFDILGLTATTPTYPNAQEIAQKAKAQFNNIPVMLGGIHATVDSLECAKEPMFDFVVVGEAECTAVELVDAIMAKAEDFSSVRGVVFKDNNGNITASGERRLTPNLDDYPLPAHHKVKNLHRYDPADAEYSPTGVIIVSRGCPGLCTYCLTKNIFGRRTRFRSPQNVLAEIRLLVNDYGVKEIHFMDDVLTANKRFVRELCTLLINEPYELRLQVANGLRADMVSKEILTLLRDAGLRNVGFGIESGDTDVLDIAKKGVSLDRVRRAVRLAKEVGLDTWGFFMFGLPGDTREGIHKTIDFAMELNVKTARFLILKPYPGSEAYYQLDEQGLVDSRDYSLYGTYSAPVHHLETLSQEDILKLQKYAYRKFYFRPSKLWEHVRGLNTPQRFYRFFVGVMFVLARQFKNTVVGTSKA
ncbi:MAG: radical SAM protein [Magnetococcales bacterium]|nr:radical SAM protein [Magnetococcales bacterium]